jgi:hypothetical protein
VATEDEDTTGTEDQGETDLSQDDATDDTKDAKDGDQKDGDQKDPKVTDAEAKAIRRRDAALKRAQRAEEEAAALREKYEKDKTDPVKVANQRLVKAEARVVLTAAGITDTGDQREVMSFLSLDDVTVDNDGNVDSDAIQERLDTLKRVFGKGQKDTKRTPRIDTRDKGGNGAKPDDPATARRKSMLGI